jgi:uncharacterized membrane protein
MVRPGNPASGLGRVDHLTVHSSRDTTGGEARMTASKSARARNARAARSGGAAGTGRTGTGRTGTGRTGTGRTGTASRNGSDAKTAKDRVPAGSGRGGQTRTQATRGDAARRGGQRPAAVPDEAAEVAAATAPSAAGPALWFQLTTLALALAGLGVSIYETYAHFNGSHLLGCNETGTIDCTKVITSPQSMVFGVIPVAILGLVFYLFVVAIMTPWAWRMQRREVAWLRLASMVVGMGFVLYLIYAELFQIGSICPYCTAVHIITFVLFMFIVFGAAAWGLSPARQRG